MKPPGRAIIERVAEEHGTTVEAIMGRNMKNPVAIAARVQAIREMRALGFSHTKIGKIVGGRSGSAICHYTNDTRREIHIAQARALTQRRRELRGMET